MDVVERIGEGDVGAHEVVGNPGHIFIQLRGVDHRSAVAEGDSGSLGQLVVAESGSTCGASIQLNCAEPVELIIGPVYEVGIRVSCLRDVAVGIQHMGNGLAVWILLLEETTGGVVEELNGSRRGVSCDNWLACLSQTTSKIIGVCDRGLPGRCLCGKPVENIKRVHNRAAGARDIS